MIRALDLHVSWSTVFQAASDPCSNAPRPPCVSPLPRFLRNTRHHLELSCVLVGLLPAPSVEWRPRESRDFIVLATRNPASVGGLGAWRVLRK